MSENGEHREAVARIMISMTLDTNGWYRALAAHDARFDGRFFVGVSTTRIYCRPICRVRAPRREHCRFFSTAAAAEAEGYRPCLRCRPELAPREAGPGNGSALAMAARAASLIEDGLLDGSRGLAQVAARLQVSDRHLRRVFQHAFGVSPVEYAQTQRLLLAKRLLTDTRLPITEVALASGFHSLRRFNALFRERYRLAPGRLRVQAASHKAADAFRFVLRFEPPFDWRHLLGFLGDRAIPGVEQVDGQVYRRTVRVEHRGRAHVGWIEVSRETDAALQVLVSPGLASVLPLVVGRVKHVFDLDCPVCEISEALGSLAAHPGVRLPGAFDGFESAVRAVLGQQVTVRAARTLAARVAATLGEPVEGAPGTLSRFFPRASTIAALDPSTLAAIGVVSTRARAIVALADAVARGDLVLSPQADVERTLERLREIPGIGPWTAQYIVMRALAWPDAFPETDYGVMKALGEKRPARIRSMAEQWRPWRAYAVMHLWRTLE